MSELALTRDLLMLAKGYDAGLSWKKAMTDSVGHLTLVIGNNDGKTLKDILAREDIKEAMSLPFEQAASDTQEAVKAAWAARVGDGHAAELSKILTSAQKMSKRAAILERKAIYAGDRPGISDRLQKVAAEMQRRAEMAVQYAQSRGEMWATLDGAADGATKTWTNDDPKCSACKALAGTTIPIHDTFDVGAGGLKLKSFGALFGPPRHPWCGCHLELG